MRFQELKLEGAEARIRFATLTNLIYQLQAATNFPAAWTPVGPPIPGTDSEAVVIDPVPPGRALRFYRISVAP